MQDETQLDEARGTLKPYLTPLGAWALALGTAIGWGSLVVTSNTYLVQAGPMESVLGLIAGAAVMLVIGRNYHYLMNHYPGADGAYLYLRETFGYDHAFLVSWFLGLTYIAMFWANATSLPLFVRYFLGNVLQFGYLFTVFGYEVFLGEALLTIGAILLAVLFCTRRLREAMWVLIVMAITLSVAITASFIGVVAGHAGSGLSFAPLTLPDKSSISQIIKIACISSWAFIGFENISNASEEFAFDRSKSYRILALSVVAATMLYIFVLLMSVSAFPAQYDNWLSYILDLPAQEGLAGFPAFFAEQTYLGAAGVWLLMIALLCLVVTSLIGNTLALSRLFYALAQDEVLPSRFAQTNSRNIPANAVVLIGLLSLPIPFLGRTAIGWIVDVTTIGATMIYGFVSASALRMAREHRDQREKTTGFIGLVAMFIFGIDLLLPNLFSAGSMAKESFLLFTVWAMMGFVFFRSILERDQKHRFGNSTVVWVALLALVLFISFVWLSQSLIASTNQTVSVIRSHYQAQMGSNATIASDESFVEGEIVALERTNLHSILLVAGLFSFSLATLLSNYAFMSRRAIETESELGYVRLVTSSDPLTGVKSRHAYLEREEQLNESIASGEIDQLGIVVCDINGLKRINDTLGHHAGDEYIRAASDLICQFFKHSPVYRIGGDEFVVLLIGRDYEDRQALMRGLRFKSRSHIATGEVIVSSGLAKFRPGEDETVGGIFHRANELMNQQKQEMSNLGED